MDTDVCVFNDILWSSCFEGKRKTVSFNFCLIINCSLTTKVKILYLIEILDLEMLFVSLKLCKVHNCLLTRRIMELMFALFK